MPEIRKKDEMKMQNEQKILTIIGSAAMLAIIALLYSVISANSISEKIYARDAAFAGLNAISNTNQLVEKPAEITLTLITDSSNQSLIKLDSLVAQLEKLPRIKIISEKKLEYNSIEATQLVEKYKIEKIPSLFIGGETEKATIISQNWQQLGTIEPDGNIVLRNIPPIYLETSTGNLRGETRATFISVPDKNGVFDAEEVYTQILQNAFGVKPVEQQTISYNSPEGKVILSKYNLEKIPTAILSGDLNAYNGFQQAWLQVGLVEADGSYVFRSLEVIGGIKYFDMNKNEVIETAQQQQ